MALNAAALAADIEGRFTALYPGLDDEDRLSALTALCEAIVTHITTNALVMPTALVAPTGGGPVTGTGTIT